MVTVSLPSALITAVACPDVALDVLAKAAGTPTASSAVSTRPAPTRLREPHFHIDFGAPVTTAVSCRILEPLGGADAPPIANLSCSCSMTSQGLAAVSRTSPATQLSPATLPGRGRQPRTLSRAGHQIA